MLKRQFIIYAINKKGVSGKRAAYLLVY